MKLSSKTAIVTGGSSGTGKSFSGENLKKGEKVVIASRSVEVVQSARRHSYLDYLSPDEYEKKNVA